MLSIHFVTYFSTLYIGKTIEISVIAHHFLLIALVKVYFRHYINIPHHYEILIFGNKYSKKLGTISYSLFAQANIES